MPCQGEFFPEILPRKMRIGAKNRNLSVISWKTTEKYIFFGKIGKIKKKEAEFRKGGNSVFNEVAYSRDFPIPD